MRPHLDQHEFCLHIFVIDHPKLIENEDPIIHLQTESLHHLECATWGSLMVIHHLSSLLY